jgi:hypothetical protein
MVKRYSDDGKGWWHEPAMKKLLCIIAAAPGWFASPGPFFGGVRS